MRINQNLINEPTNRSDLKENPLDLIEQDLDCIKQITFDHILKTEYNILRDASHYNLKLKGKNFWSCIIMLLSRALYSWKGSIQDFYKTEEYEISCLLSACVEIAHNSSLL